MRRTCARRSAALAARLGAGRLGALAAAAMAAILAASSPAFAQLYVFDYDLILTGFGRDDIHGDHYKNDQTKQLAHITSRYSSG